MSHYCQYYLNSYLDYWLYNEPPKASSTLTLLRTIVVENGDYSTENGVNKRRQSPKTATNCRLSIISNLLSIIYSRQCGRTSLVYNGDYSPLFPAIDGDNRLHFSGAGFWYVCHAYLERIRLVPDSGAD